MLIKPHIVKQNQIITYIPPIPKGMIIIRDNNEQKPYRFPECEYIDKSIDCGDYTIEGYEGQIVIERKELNDFYGSITHNRDRFDRMWERCRNAEFKGLLIEAREEEVYCPEMSFSNVNSNSIYGSIVSFQIKYNVHVYCNTREMCRQRLVNWLVKFYKEKNKKGKKENCDVVNK